jgi:hypothetical protein
VEEGVKECEGVLGENLKHIEQFFKENDSFSDERLAKYLSNVTRIQMLLKKMQGLI